MQTPNNGFPTLLRVAVTGGIGSGKSYICRRLEEAGHRIFYCDDEAKRIIRTHPEVMDKLRSLVGTEVYDGEGKLVKSVLAAYLCRGKEYAAKVDRIVHPKVAEAFCTRCREMQAEMAGAAVQAPGQAVAASAQAVQSPRPWPFRPVAGRLSDKEIRLDDLVNLPVGKVLFMECALLFESGFDRLTDCSVLVHVSALTQLERLMNRDHITAAKAREWISLQLPEAEKLRLADAFIDNEH